NLNFGVPVDYLRKALGVASPVPFAAYVKALKAVAAAAAPERVIPHHEVSMLAGCGDDELRVLRAALEMAIVSSANAFVRGTYELTYHLVEGASIEAEQRLGRTCAGPRRALMDARRGAEQLADPKAQAWAVNDAFKGVLDVIERKLAHKATLTAS